MPQRTIAYSAVPYDNQVLGRAALARRPGPGGSGFIGLEACAELLLELKPTARQAKRVIGPRRDVLSRGGGVLLAPSLPLLPAG